MALSHLFSKRCDIIARFLGAKKSNDSQLEMANNIEVQHRRDRILDEIAENALLEFRSSLKRTSEEVLKGPPKIKFTKTSRLPLLLDFSDFDSKERETLERWINQVRKRKLPLVEVYLIRRDNPDIQSGACSFLQKIRDNNKMFKVFDFHPDRPKEVKPFKSNGLIGLVLLTNLERQVTIDDVISARSYAQNAKANLVLIVVNQDEIEMNDKPLELDITIRKLGKVENKEQAVQTEDEVFNHCFSQEVYEDLSDSILDNVVVLEDVDVQQKVSGTGMPLPEEFENNSHLC